jgi:hypothetical protein
MKVRGAQRRPIMNEREKFRVARVERERPSRSSANDLIKRYCWGTIGREIPRPLDSSAARIKGRTMSTTTKI